jgi:hypothetical protein
MGRRASGQILTSADADGETTYSVRFRGDGYPKAVILLGSSRDRWTRARAKHESRIIAAQIRAGTWLPLPTPEYETTERPTFRELASDHYHRKRRKGLRPNSLADMLNKLSAHLLPFFAEYRVDEIDESLVEEYIDHKQRENAELAALEASGRPALNRAGRPHRQLKPGTINTQLHLLAEILERAVRYVPARPQPRPRRGPAPCRPARAPLRPRARRGVVTDRGRRAGRPPGHPLRQAARADRRPPRRETRLD